MLAVMSAEKKPRAPKGTGRAGTNINVWIDPQLAAVLETYRIATRHKKNAMMEVVIEAFLRAQGLWPPPEEEGDDEEAPPKKGKKKS
jgi:hypothetical protein